MVSLYGCDEVPYLSTDVSEWASVEYGVSGSATEPEAYLADGEALVSSSRVSDEAFV